MSDSPPHVTPALSASGGPEGWTPLIEEARAGSTTALGSLLEAARAYLLLLADRDLPTALRAKVGPSDVVQETAIDAQRDFCRFRGTTREQLYAWLRTILQNNITDAVRRFEMTQKRAAGREESLSVVVDHRGVRLLGSLGSSPDRSAIRREDAAIIADMLSRLPADYALVLRLRYWESLTFPQIADRMERSEEAVRKLWYRAIARIDAELHPTSPTPSEPRTDS